MIRVQRASDEMEIEALTRLAFWSEDRFIEEGIGCEEHYLIRLLRQCEAYIPELEMVYLLDGKIVGHILYTMAKVVSHEGVETQVLCFGPLSVHPDYQRQGIGIQLMRSSFEKAIQMGYGRILIYGHPEYYKKVGFKPASDFGICTHEGHDLDALMALKLVNGALKGVQGRFYYAEAYNVNAEEVMQYDVLAF